MLCSGVSEYPIPCRKQGATVRRFLLIPFLCSSSILNHCGNMECNQQTLPLLRLNVCIQLIKTPFKLSIISG